MILIGATGISNPSTLAAIIVSCLVFLTLDGFLMITLRKWMVLGVTAFLQVSILVSGYFGADILFFVCIVLFLVYLFGLIFCNLGALRWFFSAPGSKGKGPIGLKRKEKNSEPSFDRDRIYEKVKNAVLTLSRQKIGALITFERRDDLTDLIKNGTIVNAPVSSELLQTIFYPGTRLHDGAVVIRGDKILAASVYFTPTSRPLTGKFGSRHRAAFGICETTDSVTIVVSEETGRISIAYDGDLTSVNPDNFMRIFKEDMEGSDKEEKQSSKEDF